MEAQNDKAYVHYNHTDSCRFSRWTARHMMFTVMIKLKRFLVQISLRGGQG
ncbi:hypothetical protein Peur_033400 [Populus x canadensis]